VSPVRVRQEAPAKRWKFSIAFSFCFDPFVDRKMHRGYTYKKMNRSGCLRRPAPRTGMPLAKPGTIWIRQSLPYQGRWQCEALTERLYKGGPEKEGD
jgi:hypothetical protein